MIVCFPHIPKAGGQTLLQGFYKAFGFKKCIKVWNPDFGADVSPMDFPSLSSEQFKGMSAVVGHLSLSDFLMNSHARGEFDKGNVKIITSVRNPIERILSSYNYMFYNEKHPNHENIKNKLPIDFIMNQPANFQYNFLKPKTESLLADLFETIEIFPIENSIPKFIAFFEKNFNIELGGLEVKNKSIDLASGRKMISLEDINKDVFDYLEKKHQMDFDLYHKSFEN